MTDEKGVAARRKREADRRASQLRANLARRKAQAQARKAATERPPTGGGRGRE